MTPAAGASATVSGLNGTVFTAPAGQAVTLGSDGNNGTSFSTGNGASAASGDIFADGSGQFSQTGTVTTFGAGTQLSPTGDGTILTPADGASVTVSGLNGSLFTAPPGQAVSLGSDGNNGTAFSTGNGASAASGYIFADGSGQLSQNGTVTTFGAGTQLSPTGNGTVLTPAAGASVSVSGLNGTVFTAPPGQAVTLGSGSAGSTTFSTGSGDTAASGIVAANGSGLVAQNGVYTIFGTGSQVGPGDGGFAVSGAPVGSYAVAQPVGAPTTNLDGSYSIPTSTGTLTVYPGSGTNPATATFTPTNGAPVPLGSLGTDGPTAVTPDGAGGTNVSSGNGHLLNITANGAATGLTKDPQTGAWTIETSSANSTMTAHTLALASDVGTLSLDLLQAAQNPTPITVINTMTAAAKLTVDGTLTGTDAKDYSADLAGVGAGLAIAGAIENPNIVSVTNALMQTGYAAEQLSKGTATLTGKFFTTEMPVFGAALGLVNFAEDPNIVNGIEATAQVAAAAEVFAGNTAAAATFGEVGAFFALGYFIGSWLFGGHNNPPPLPADTMTGWQAWQSGLVASGASATTWSYGGSSSAQSLADQLSASGAKMESQMVTLGLDQGAYIPGRAGNVVWNQHNGYGVADPISGQTAWVGDDTQALAREWFLVSAANHAFGDQPLDQLTWNNYANGGNDNGTNGTGGPAWLRPGSIQVDGAWVEPETVAYQKAIAGTLGTALPFSAETAKVYAIAAAEDAAPDPTLLADATSGDSGRQAVVDDRYDQDFHLGQYGFGDAVVLNLEGGPVETTNRIGSAAAFDMGVTGQTEQTGWITAGEGFLVMAPAGSTAVGDRSQMVSSALLPNLSNGLAALAALDSDGDGVITNKDPIWSQLGVWIDSDGNGVCEPGEVVSLDQLGITAITLTATAADTYNNGNTILATATFTYADGNIGSLADVLFNYATNTGTQVFATDGGTVVENADGSAVEAVTAGQTVTLDPKGGITALEGVTAGNTIDIDGVPISGASVPGGVMTVDTLSGSGRTMDASDTGADVIDDQAGGNTLIAGSADGVVLIAGTAPAASPRRAPTPRSSLNVTSGPRRRLCIKRRNAISCVMHQAQPNREERDRHRRGRVRREEGYTACPRDSDAYVIASRRGIGFMLVRPEWTPVPAARSIRCASTPTAPPSAPTARTWP